MHGDFDYNEARSIQQLSNTSLETVFSPKILSLDLFTVLPSDELLLQFGRQRFEISEFELASRRLRFVQFKNPCRVFSVRLELWDRLIFEWPEFVESERRTIELLFCSISFGVRQLSG